jgi:hypothetical protein
MPGESIVVVIVMVMGAEEFLTGMTLPLAFSRTSPTTPEYLQISEFSMNFLWIIL